MIKYWYQSIIFKNNQICISTYYFKYWFIFNMKLQYGEPEALVQESNSSLNFEYWGNNVSDEGEVSDSNCSRKKDFEVHKNMLINISKF